MVPHPGGGTAYGRILPELWITLPHRPQQPRPVRPMIKTLSLLCLGAALYAPIGAVGAAAIGFAADTVSSLNAATAARCDTYNSVLPGSCRLP